MPVPGRPAPNRPVPASPVPVRPGCGNAKDACGNTGGLKRTGRGLPPREGNRLSASRSSSTSTLGRKRAVWGGAMLWLLIGKGVPRGGASGSRGTTLADLSDVRAGKHETDSPRPGSRRSSNAGAAGVGRREQRAGVFLEALEAAVPGNLLELSHGGGGA